MKTIIDIADQDYQYCLDYASGKTNTMALNNVHRIIKAVVDGTPLDENKISFAIDTMRKYQKIEEIVKSKTTRLSYEDGFRQIKEVLEDGNDD